MSEGKQSAKLAEQLGPRLKEAGKRLAGRARSQGLGPLLLHLLALLLFILSIITPPYTLGDKGDANFTKEAINAFRFYGTINFCILLTFTLFTLFDITKNWSLTKWVKTFSQRLWKTALPTLYKLIALEIFLLLFGTLASLSLGIPIHPTQKSLKDATISAQNYLVSEPWQPLKGALALLLAYIGYKNWKSVHAQVELARVRDVVSRLNDRLALALEMLNKDPQKPQPLAVATLITLVDECELILQNRANKDLNFVYHTAQSAIDAICSHIKSLSAAENPDPKSSNFSKKTVEKLLLRSGKASFAKRVETALRIKTEYISPNEKNDVYDLVSSGDLGIPFSRAHQVEPDTLWSSPYSYDFEGVNFLDLDLSGMNIGRNGTKVSFRGAVFKGELNISCSTIGGGVSFAEAKFEQVKSCVTSMEAGVDFTDTKFREPVTFSNIEMGGIPENPISFRRATFFKGVKFDEVDGLHSIWDISCWMQVEHVDFYKAQTESIVIDGYRFPTEFNIESPCDTKLGTRKTCNSCTGVCETCFRDESNKGCQGHCACKICEVCKTMLNICVQCERWENFYPCSLPINDELAGTSIAPEHVFCKLENLTLN
ncbi:pentapeptide repeat-containing protein [Dermabacteraceae bacterium P13264]